MKMKYSVGLSVLVFLVVAVSGVSAQDQSVFEPRATAQLLYFEGDVRIDAVSSVIGQLISYGSIIQTADDSYAELTIGSGNILRIQENTVMILDLAPGALRVDLRTGSVGAVLNGLDRISPNVERSRPRFYLETQGTVAGVRGTTFFAQIESRNTTYVCTCNGTLEFEGNGYSTFEAEYYHHGARRFVTAPDGRMTVEVAPLLYHDDTLMDEIAARIGETIDWSEGH